MKKCVLFPTLLVSFLFLFSAAFAAEVKIGLIYPLSGPVSPIGITTRNAIELAADIVNSTKYKHLNVPLAGAGGLPNLNGSKVKLVFSDSQGTPELGLSEAERLITQEKVVALIGATQSSVTQTASMVAERMKVPFINFDSSSPKLTRRGFKWFFRICPHDEIYSEIIFDFLRDLRHKKGLQFKTVAVIYEDTLFGKDSSQILKDLAKRDGYEIVADVPYRRSATSLTSEILRLKAANPDILFPSVYVSDGILMTKTAKEMNFNVPIIVLQGMTDPSYAKALGKDVDGISTRDDFSLELAKHKPVIGEVNMLYKERFGTDMTGISSRPFVGFLALCEAMNRAGSTDPNAIRQALRETNIPGEMLITPWRGIKFDETGQNVLGDGIITQYQDGGKPYPIYPFNLATREVICPIPNWSMRR